MIVGGVDVLVGPLMVTGFSLLGALSTRNDDPQRASRPFDVDRYGFVLGEGAGFLLIESEDSARSTGRVPLAELSGYGNSCNAWRITDSPPDGRGAAQSMAAALEAASLCSCDAFMVSTLPLARGQGLSTGASQNLRDRCALRSCWTTRLASLKPRAGSSYKAPRGFRSGASAARRLHPRLGDGRRAAISKDFNR